MRLRFRENLKGKSARPYAPRRWVNKKFAFTQYKGFGLLRRGWREWRMHETALDILAIPLLLIFLSQNATRSVVVRNLYNKGDFHIILHWMFLISEWSSSLLQNYVSVFEQFIKVVCRISNEVVTWALDTQVGFKSSNKFLRFESMFSISNSVVGKFA